MKKLCVQFDWENDKVRTVKLNMNMIETEFSRLFSSEFGKFPNFQHHIHLTSNAIPVAKKLRSSPIAVEPFLMSWTISNVKEHLSDRQVGMGSLDRRGEEERLLRRENLWGHDKSEPLHHS